MSDHNDPEFGFDKTAALSDPGPERDFPVPTPMYGHHAPSEARRSPVETTPASARPIPPEGSERPADEAEACTDVIRRTSLDTIVRLTKERNEAREDCGFQKGLKDSIKGELMVFIRLRQEALDTIAERDATIERLWAQLNEATNVPDALVGIGMKSCQCGPFTIGVEPQHHTCGYFYCQGCPDEHNHWGLP